MSGATIGGVVGAVVGSFIPGVGTQLGWMIGSMIGGYVDPEQISQFGPRLSDAAQQTAQDGLPIAYGWGTFPCKGNIIWRSPVAEHINESTDDGKGSGVETTTTTYTYTRSYAIAICQGPIAGLLQIKRNGKVVWDVRTEEEFEFVFNPDGASSMVDVVRQIIEQARAYTSRFSTKLAIYTGTETQLPDATIEAYEGVGEVNGNRGLAYIVVTDDDVTELRGAIPQYDFVVRAAGEGGEVCNTGFFAPSSTTADFYRGVVEGDTRTLDTLALGGDKYDCVTMPDHRHVWVSDRDNGKVYKVETSLMKVVATATVPGVYGLACDAEKLYAYNQTDHQIHVLSAVDGSGSLTWPINVGNRGWMALEPDGATLWIAGDGGSVIRYVNTTTGTATSIAVPSNPGSGRPTVNPSGTKVYACSDFDNIQVIDIATKTIIGTVGLFGAKQVAFLPDESKFYVTNVDGSGNVQVYSGADDSFITEVDTTGTLFGVCVDPDGEKVFAIGNTGNRVYEIDSATDAIVHTHVLTNSVESICSRALP